MGGRRVCGEATLLAPTCQRAARPVAPKAPIVMWLSLSWPACQRRPQVWACGPPLLPPGHEPRDGRWRGSFCVTRSMCSRSGPAWALGTRSLLWTTRDPGWPLSAWHSRCDFATPHWPCAGARGCGQLLQREVLCGLEARWLGDPFCLCLDEMLGSYPSTAEPHVGPSWSVGPWDCPWLPEGTWGGQRACRVVRSPEAMWAGLGDARWPQLALRVAVHAAPTPSLRRL